MSETASKKPYSTPQLVAYGSVKDLTAGGSGITSEWMLVQVGKMPPECKQVNMGMNNEDTGFC